MQLAARASYIRTKAIRDENRVETGRTDWCILFFFFFFFASGRANLSVVDERISPPRLASLVLLQLRLLGETEIKGRMAREGMSVEHVHMCTDMVLQVLHANQLVRTYIRTDLCAGAPVVHRPPMFVRLAPPSLGWLLVKAVGTVHVHISRLWALWSVSPAEM